MPALKLLMLHMLSVAAGCQTVHFPCPFYLQLLAVAFAACCDFGWYVAAVLGVCCICCRHYTMLLQLCLVVCLLDVAG